jgi:transposase InsO family protein
MNIGKYLKFYNEERLHQALDYNTPSEVYFSGQVDREAINC